MDKDLITRNSTNIVPIGTASLTYWSSRDCSNGWNQTSASTGQYKPNDATILNCTYYSTNGLYYSNCINQQSWGTAKITCENKGMRLPTQMEVPSCSSNNWTWSSTVHTNGNHIIWRNSESNAQYGDDSYLIYRQTRCVK